MRSFLSSALQAAIVGIAIGGLIVGIGLGINFVITPKPKVEPKLLTYTVQFGSGETSEIGALYYDIKGSCVIFYRVDKTMAICNVPLSVFYDKAAQEPQAPAGPANNGTPRSSSTQAQSY